MGGKGECFSGTTIRDTWTKPRGSGIRGGRWGWLGLQEEEGRKGRLLYLNNNKILKNRKKVIYVPLLILQTNLTHLSNSWALCNVVTL